MVVPEPGGGRVEAHVAGLGAEQLEGQVPDLLPVCPVDGINFRPLDLPQKFRL